MPTKYWLSTLPEDNKITGSAIWSNLAKLRWRVERDYHELRQELPWPLRVVAAGAAFTITPRSPLPHTVSRTWRKVQTDWNAWYAGTSKEIETRRRSFIRKWRLKCRALADSLEEAGDRLFTFTRLPDSQWRSARTTNAIERLHEEFKRRIKTQTVLPSAKP